MIKKLWLVFIGAITMCCLAPLLHAEDSLKNYTFDFTTISSEQGLSQDSVNGIIQDRLGFLWIATTDGLNRYDGYNFKKYLHHPDKPNSLSDKWVRTLIQDGKGRIWIGTNRGLDCLDPATDQITSINYIEDNNNCIKLNNINALFGDVSGNIWIGLRDGVIRFEPSKKKFKCYYPNTVTADRMFPNAVEFISDTTDHTLITVCSGDLYYYDDSRNCFLPFRRRYPIPELESNIRTFFCDSKGTFWIGTNGSGLIRFDPIKNKMTIFKYNPNDPSTITENQITTIHETPAGEIWIGTVKEGLNLLDPKTDTFIRFVHNEKNNNSLADNNVKKIITDRSGLLWVGTYGNGLSRIRKKKNIFKTYRYLDGKPEGLSNPSVFCMGEDASGNLWVGTSNGLNRLDQSSGRFRHYFNQKGNPHSLSADVIAAITLDSSKRLWFGTVHGLNRYEPKTDSFIQYFQIPGDLNSLSNNVVSSICKSNTEPEILWIGTGGGINQLNINTGKFTRYFFRKDNPESLNSSKIVCILEDRRGTLWAGTHDAGLNRLNKGSNEFIQYMPALKNNREGISHPFILSLCETGNGEMWIGTLYGLNHMNKEKGTFKKYFEEDGLCNNTIYAILEDINGNLWMSTNKGVSRFNPETGTFKNYTVNDGLQNNEFNSHAGFASSSGKLYLGGIDGFNEFMSETGFENLFIPPVVFSGFNVVGRTENLSASFSHYQDINYQKKVKIEYDGNNFSVEFAALDYRNPEKNQYAYKLENFDHNWHYCGSRRLAAYANLVPGDYTFMVKGTNSDGIWNESPRTIRIIIPPPFWQTLWFKLLVVISLVIAIVGIFRYRIKRIQQKMIRDTRHQLRLQRMELEKERLQKEVELKADFTAMMVHDLRSPLTAIMGYAELMLDEPDEVDIHRSAEVIKRSSTSMMKLINEMLDLAKFEAGKMTLTKRTCYLDKIVDEILEEMTPILHSKQLYISRIYDPLKSLNADSDRLGQVVQNLISNAYKFSPQKGTITVRIKNIEPPGRSFQMLSIEDEGFGIAPEKQAYLFDKYAQFHGNTPHKGTGLGLAVSKLIIEAHGGTIGFKAGPSKGSIFYFSVPLDF